MAGCSRGLHQAADSESALVDAECCMHSCSSCSYPRGQGHSTCQGYRLVHPVAEALTDRRSSPDCSIETWAGFKAYRIFRDESSDARIVVACPRKLQVGFTVELAARELERIC